MSERTAAFAGGRPRDQIDEVVKVMLSKGLLTGLGGDEKRLGAALCLYHCHATLQLCSCARHNPTIQQLPHGFPIRTPDIKFSRSAAMNIFSATRSASIVNTGGWRS